MSHGKHVVTYILENINELYQVYMFIYNMLFIYTLRILYKQSCIDIIETNKWLFWCLSTHKRSSMDIEKSTKIYTFTVICSLHSYFITKHSVYCLHTN